MLTRRVIEDHQPAEETQHHQHTKDKLRYVFKNRPYQKNCVNLVHGFGLPNRPLTNLREWTLVIDPFAMVGIR